MGGVSLIKKILQNLDCVTFGNERLSIPEALMRYAEIFRYVGSDVAAKKFENSFLPEEEVYIHEQFSLRFH
jgi:hypothetical protein